MVVDSGTEEQGYFPICGDRALELCVLFLNYIFWKNHTHKEKRTHKCSFPKNMPHGSKDLEWWHEVQWGTPVREYNM